MTDREKKRKHHTEPEEHEAVIETEVQLMLRHMMEESKRNEARREAKRAEARMIAAEERAEIRRREERIAEEERLEARRLGEKIAEEERMEARRVAAEEREEKRAEAKRLRKLEEERKLEEKEAAREEAARLASEALKEQQEAASRRAYEQQVALVRLQSEIGDKAAEAHRVEQATTKKKERAISSVGILREEEDIEDFLATSERKLRAGGVPQEEWVSVIASKLCGKVGSTWHDLTVEKEDYCEVKAGLLKVCGYTPKLAGELFFSFKAEDLKGVTADQLYARGVQLVRRMVAPHKLASEVEFLLVKPWLWSVIPRRARQMLDARAVNSSEELLEGLQDFLVIEGERKEGQAAVFNKTGGDGGRMTPLVCFSCGKIGHKAVDCWGSNSASPYPTGSGTGSAVPQVTCFGCGEVGHKSNVCPNKGNSARVVKPGRAEPKEVFRPVNRLKGHPKRDTMLDMVINGQEVSVLLDSGSAVTILPEKMVAQAQRLKETVELKGFGAKESFVFQLAEVPFEVGGSRWVETVAVAPDETGCEVIYGLNLASLRGLELVYMVNKGRMVEEERSRAAGVGPLVADRPASGTAPVVRQQEEGVEQEEDVEEEVEEEEEEEGIPVYRMRRLAVINHTSDCSMSDLGVVEGDGKRLETLQQSSSVSCGNVSDGVVCHSNEEEEDSVGSIQQVWRIRLHKRQKDKLCEQPEEQPRAAVVSVGGDVGTAHRRREREREKETKEKT